MACSISAGVIVGLVVFFFAVGSAYPITIPQQSRGTQQGTAAERSHLRRRAKAARVIESIVVQPFTLPARAVSGIQPVVCP